MPSIDIVNWFKEIRAVGVLRDGGLIPINEVEDADGANLSGLILSPKHRIWFKENERRIRRCLAPSSTILVIGSSDSNLEIF